MGASRGDFLHLLGRRKQLTSTPSEVQPGCGKSKPPSSHSFHDAHNQHSPGWPPNTKQLPKIGLSTLSTRPARVNLTVPALEDPPVGPRMAQVAVPLDQGVV